MIIALPHQTLTEYLRAFFLSNLALFCAGACPVCRHDIQVIGLRLRLVLDIPVYRGRCTNKRCKTYFTFLPSFAAPAKWCGYAQIEEALTFLAKRETTLTSALDVWRADRDNRIENGEPAGPSVSTLRRWWQEFSEASASPVWKEQVMGLTNTPVTKVLPASIAHSSMDAVSSPVSLVTRRPRRRISEPNRCSSSAVGPEAFLFLLLHLAASLFPEYAPASISYLGLGIRTLEARVGRRLLARSTLVGRVIPGSSPNMVETGHQALVYDPEPP